ncbi:glycosyltransferase family 9 protein [Elioraea rosea]|uniref:glycosyltransferase family 9 protein n=1 Tax=Elioraea rosea TaxID=2492390 RepID=UPI001186C34D|nr:glycosyltransferase family 9 protein [Elioraea rosea]
MKPVLVIKHGALGDLVQAFGPFAAIRAHHKGAAITLLTTRPFVGLMAKAPWFDRVEADDRPAWWNLPAWLALGRRLAGAGYGRVYDLQTSDRSSRMLPLMRLLGARPEWSGIARGASHPHANPGRDAMHTADRQREQLEMAGITAFPPPDLGWLAGDVSRFGLPARYALLVPGAAPHRPAKRWPADAYGALAAHLAGRGIAPVVIGTGAEAPLAATIRDASPEAIDLTGRTAIADIGALAAGAALAIGNDTGPMHLVAGMGTPALVLFSHDSDPALCAPRGPAGKDTVRVLRVADLRSLAPETVIASLPAP